MRNYRRPILTLLLVVWTTVESATVGLMHFHGHGGHSPETGWAVCDVPDSHDHAASEAAHRHAGQLEASKGHQDAVAADELGHQSGWSAGDAFSHEHPDDCTICRHFSQGRSLAVLAGLAVSGDSCPAVDDALPANPLLAAPAVLHLRGPPSRVAHC